MSKELKQYVETALSRGASSEEVAKTLADSGWSEDVVRKVLEQFAGADAYGVPIPAPRMAAHHIARDIFVYLLILITLTISAVALGAILFDWVETLWPDVTHHRYRGDHNINWAIAQLVIAFPVYLWLTGWVNRDIRRHAEKRESLIRKLMIYWLLAETAIISLCDLIAVLNAFLNGDLTASFFAKAVVVLGIAGAVFAYYLYEVKRDDRLVQRRSQKPLEARPA